MAIHVYLAAILGVLFLLALGWYEYHVFGYYRRTGLPPRLFPTAARTSRVYSVASHMFLWGVGLALVGAFFGSLIGLIVPTMSLTIGFVLSGAMFAAIVGSIIGIFNGLFRGK